MKEKAFPELDALRAQQDRYGKLDGFDCESIGGMTLRDYFAAKAMAVILADAKWDRSDYLNVSTLAYVMADAMLKAREQGEPS